MDELRDPFYGIFTQAATAAGDVRLARHSATPLSLPDPKTGRALRIVRD